MTTCSHCNGKGGLDTWGDPCIRSSMHFKAACPQCTGTGQVMAGTQQCTQCGGKGNFDRWGDPCEATSMHKKDVCHMCQGRGTMAPVLAVPVGGAAPPVRGAGPISSVFRSLGL